MRLQAVKVFGGTLTREALLCISCLVLVPSLPAGTIVSSFGPGQTFNSSFVDNVGGASQQSLAASFTPSAAYTLSTIDLAATWITGPNQLTVLLTSDAGGVPGSTIESFNLTNFSGFYVPGVVTATSVLHPTLMAGTTYWVELTANDLVDTLDGWYPVLNSVTYGGFGESAYRSGAGAWNVSGVGVFQAFDVTGTAATPEPSTLALVVIALLVGLTYRLLHKQYSH